MMPVANSAAHPAAHRHRRAPGARHLGHQPRAGRGLVPGQPEASSSRATSRTAACASTSRTWTGARPARSARRGSPRRFPVSRSRRTARSWPPSAPTTRASSCPSTAADPADRRAGGGRVPAALLARRALDLRLEARRRAGPRHAAGPRVRGGRELWKDLLPADPAGVERISNVLVTPDGKGYAYCYARLLSDLFVVEGLR